MAILALVASTTLSRRPLSAWPTISSDSPREYMSAVSTKLIPASRALWMIRIESSWSGLPMAPNIMAPRQYGLTLMPVRPSVRYFMVLLVCWPLRAEARLNGAGFRSNYTEHCSG
jgi:hypothetical protein